MSFVYFRSQTKWQMKSTFTGDVFSGPLFVIVEANSTNEYPITYRPLYMTNDENPNKASFKNFELNLYFDSIVFKY